LYIRSKAGAIQAARYNAACASLFSIRRVAAAKTTTTLNVAAAIVRDGGQPLVLRRRKMSQDVQNQ
jgi:hypothetical protein